MSDRTILITAPFSERERERLGEYGTVVYVPWTNNGVPHTEEEMVALVQQHRPTALIVELDPVTETVLSASEIAVVGCCRAGVVNIDVDAATARGVQVLRTPGRNAEAVAQYVVGMMIVSLRNFVPARDWMLSGQWGNGERPYLKFRGAELGTMTVALHGYGAVGRRVAELLHPFGPRVLAVDPYVSNSEASNVTMVDVRTAYEEADILSIHLPVTPETSGSVDADLIGLLKRDAILINSARAAVMDYDAVEAAVNAERIRAVLDVYREEPLSDVDRHLVAHPNVVATPHLAGATHEVVMHHSMAMAGAISAALAGEPVGQAYKAN